MTLLLKSGFVILFFLVFFGFISIFPEKILKLPMPNVIHRVLYGFFFSMLFFEILYLPFVLLKLPFHILKWTFLLIIIAGLLIAAYWYVKKVSVFSSHRIMDSGVTVTNAFLLVAFVATILATGFAMLQKYDGWDTTFYVGTINTTLYEDTMYLVDGRTGIPAETIDFRYALSGFYIFFTIFASLFHLPARVMAFFVMRGLCVILAAAIVYLAGEILFRKNRKKASVLLICYLFVMFFWTPLHSTAYFLFIRGYEAKGFCANVVIPAFLYGVLLLFKETKEPKQEDAWLPWKRMFLISWASVPISMSAMAIIPAGIFVSGLTLFFMRKQKMQILFGSFCSTLFNVLILFPYFLSTKDIISIATGY